MYRLYCLLLFFHTLGRDSWAWTHVQAPPSTEEEEAGPPLDPGKSQEKGSQAEEEEDSMEGGMGLFDEDASESTWAPRDTPQQRLERLLQLQPPPQPRKALRKEKGRDPISAFPIPSPRQLSHLCSPSKDLAHVFGFRALS